jgi:hypothetical protein
MHLSLLRFWVGEFESNGSKQGKRRTKCYVTRYSQVENSAAVTGICTERVSYN